MQVLQLWKKNELFLIFFFFFFHYQSYAMHKYIHIYRHNDLLMTVEVEFKVAPSFFPSSPFLCSSCFLPSSLFFFHSFSFTIGSQCRVRFFEQHGNISKAASSEKVLRSILPTCSVKASSSCALLADGSWFSVDKEGSKYRIRFVLFFPMIKRRKFPLPSFEIFAEVHSQQISLLRAFAIVRDLQIFLLPPSPLPPQIKNEFVGSYQSAPRN